MNIALRPSGGRGEYELAGSQGDLRPQDLFHLPISIETVPGVAVQTHSVCQRLDGKPRIRLTVSGVRNAHPSAVVAAAMLLPEPRRTKREALANTLICRRGFVVQTVRVDVVPNAGGVVLRPVIVRLENGRDVKADINFAERMARVVRVWVAAATGSDAVSVAVRAHATAFGAPNAPHQDVLSATPNVRAALGDSDEDLLPLLERRYSLPGQLASTGSLSADLTDDDLREETEIDPVEARIERVREWRLASERGSGAAAFRQRVREAYDDRCVFSGQRLPRTELTSRVGVDAAHILPWSRYDLDDTRNGLCLAKQCHWAFDQGILRLTYDDRQTAYVLAIPEQFKTAAVAARFDLPEFEKLEGVVPEARLPKNRALWPSKTYLRELNQYLDGRLA
jgi:hypothetical protein